MMNKLGWYTLLIQRLNLLFMYAPLAVIAVKKII
jgi:hypothetical protein